MVKSDETLSIAWTSVWEKNSGPLVENFERTIGELEADLRSISGTPDAAPADRYARLAKSIGALERAQRGSGTKTALLASALAWLFRDEPPNAGLVAGANLIDSDSDTICTMAGAILGAVTDVKPEGAILDRPYMEMEAARMAAISEGRLVDTFAYPDLLRWTPPKTQVDLVRLDGDAWRLVGLGILKPIGDSHKTNEKHDILVQRFETEFGQTLFCRFREQPRSFRPSDAAIKPQAARKAVKIASGNRPVSTQHQQLSLIETESVSAPSTRTDIGSLTDAAIKAGFDPQLIGTHIHRLAREPAGIEKVLGYAAIIAKAIEVRTRRK